MNSTVFTLFIIIWIYFAAGAVLIYFINRRTTSIERKNAWIKYFVFMAIINLFFLTIVYYPARFKWLALLVTIGSSAEIFRLLILSKKIKENLPVLLIFSLILPGFMMFSGLGAVFLIYVFIVTMVFDAFSQLSGQLLGKTHFLKKISPNKTIEGTIGGTIMAVTTSVLLKDELWWLGDVLPALLFGLLISFGAFTGDLVASFYKRINGVKDFSKLIPGHGGILDRFDSLIFSGSLFWVIINLF